MNILGINAYHANASAALVCDGKLVAAVEEERLNRVKYAAGFPLEAIRYCVKAAGITVADIDHVAIPRNPLGENRDKTALRHAHASFRARAGPSLGFVCGYSGDAGACV